MYASSSESVGWVCLNIWKNVKVTYGVLEARDGLSSLQILRYHLLGQKDTQRGPVNLSGWIILVWWPPDSSQRTRGTHLEDNHLHKSLLWEASRKRPSRSSLGSASGLSASPEPSTEGCFLSLRGYFWLFIVSQRKSFSKHRPKDKNLLHFSLHFWTSEF